MPLPYGLPAPANALAAAVPEVLALLHFVRLGLVGPSAETLFFNELPEPFKSLLDPFCAELPGPFKLFRVDPFCSGLAALAVAATAAACVTVTVY